jgi:hypothetical protein
MAALPHNNWVTAQEISIRSMNTMRGKMCSAIESLNLPENQETAVIALIKQFSYDAQETVAQLLQHVDEGEKQFKYSNHLLEVKKSAD